MRKMNVFFWSLGVVLIAAGVVSAMSNNVGMTTLFYAGGTICFGAVVIANAIKGVKI